MRITTFQFCHLDWAGSAALESAKNIRNELVRSLEIGYLVPYLPENLIPEVLEIARNIGDESLRAEGLNGLVTNVHKMFDSFPYDFWCELIHSLARLKRKKLLLTIGENSRVIRELGGSETFREIADAVNDVGRWFP